jgi:hypothetical protein
LLRERMPLSRLTNRPEQVQKGRSVYCSCEPLSPGFRVISYRTLRNERFALLRGKINAHLIVL